MPGEKINETEVVAPAMTELVRLAGNADQNRFVQYVTIKGLAFQHADWELAPEGNSSTQAAVEVPAAVMADGALNCRMENCEVAHVGNYEIWFRRGCKDCGVYYNRLYDLGAGGIRVGEDKMARTAFWPDAAWRDVVFSVVMLGGIVALALVFGPPELGKPPDPSIIEAYPRPDWYLLWYFAVLALLPHGTENYFIVFGPLLAGLLLICLPFISNRGERSPQRRPWAIAITLLVVIMIGVFWRAGISANWSPNFNALPLPKKVVGASTGPVAEGARVFYFKGCINCHLIERYGGRRGPSLTAIGNKLNKDQMILRISNGGLNNARLHREFDSSPTGRPRGIS